MRHKKRLLEILKNPNDKLLAIDMDGTICKGEFWGDEDPKPKTEFIEKMWKWYKGGAHIIIYTARHTKYYAHTHAWLIKYGVPFHGITMQMKPGADVYIDDKSLNIDDLYGN